MAQTAGGTYYAASSELVSSWPATSLDLANQLETRFAAKANLASPTLTGTPAAPTAASGTNTTQVATTAFVQTAIGAGAWTGYTPTITAATTNPTLGTGSTQQGAYLKIGRLVIARFFIQFGTSGTANGSGTYYVSLPVNSVGYAGTMGSGSIGQGTDLRLVTWRTQDNTKIVGLLEASDYIGSNTPAAWGANNVIDGLLIYEAAS